MSDIVMMFSLFVDCPHQLFCCSIVILNDMEIECLHDPEL